MNLKINLPHYPTRWARHADLIVHIVGLAFALFGGGVALGLAVSHGLIGKVAKVKDDQEIMVDIADNVQVRVLKSTLTEVRVKSPDNKD